VEDLMSRPCALSAPQFTQGTPGADARELSNCEVGAPGLGELVRGRASEAVQAQALEGVGLVIAVL
jgi:hypothetical protein